MLRYGPGRLLYAPYHVQLVVTRKCNLSCGYCNEFDDHSPAVPFETLCERMDKIKELGAWACEFTGGEPMEHPQLIDLVRYAKQTKKFFKVQLISNLYLWNEQTVHKLNDAGLDDLQVSVDGVMPNDVTIKVLKPMRKKLEVLAKHAKFRVTMSGVVGSAPPGEAVEVLKFAIEHGFKPRAMLVHDGNGQLSIDEARRAEIEEIKGVLGSNFKTAGDYRAKLMDSGRAPFKCRSGSRYLYVDEFGFVRWCSQTRDYWGVPLAEYTFAHLKEQFATRKDCSDACTIGCVRTASAPDAWRPQNRRDPGPAGPPPGTLVQIGHRKPAADSTT